ncbi:hypothetical protein B0A71_09190 [Flavobacterium tructae]|uniref:Uncharacterized protein n=1 Tax=Flavobacterium tructae TaxID=1114873 RepID=A0A1S1JCM7_9FLAO|nr:hypothetical protein BHE19_20020 [Flavobacterium tructae]OXB19622.1 hypothetical protein B0A71_09190 [Flavobacterium tructae]
MRCEFAREFYGSSGLTLVFFFYFDFISKYKCFVFSKAFFYGLFPVIKNWYKPVSSVKSVGQKKTLPFAKSKKRSVFN